MAECGRCRKHSALLSCLRASVGICDPPGTANPLSPPGRSARHSTCAAGRVTVRAVPEAAILSCLRASAGVATRPAPPTPGQSQVRLRPHSSPLEGGGVRVPFGNALDGRTGRRATPPSLLPPSGGRGEKTAAARARRWRCRRAAAKFPNAIALVQGAEAMGRSPAPSLPSRCRRKSGCGTPARPWRGAGAVGVVIGLLA